MKTIIFFTDGHTEGFEGALPNFSMEDTPPILYLHDAENRVVSEDIPLSRVSHVAVEI